MSDETSARLGLTAGLLQLVGALLAFASWRVGADSPYQPWAEGRHLCMVGAGLATACAALSWFVPSARMAAVLFALLAGAGAIGVEAREATRFAFAMIAMMIGCAMPTELRGAHA